MTYFELANEQRNYICYILSLMNTFTLQPHGPGKLLLTLQDPAQASPPLESLPYLYLPGPINTSLSVLPPTSTVCLFIQPLLKCLQFVLLLFP